MTRLQSTIPALADDTLARNTTVKVALLPHELAARWLLVRDVDRSRSLQALVPEVGKQVPLLLFLLFITCRWMRKETLNLPASEETEAASCAPLQGAGVLSSSHVRHQEHQRRSAGQSHDDCVASAT
jgi:hypothetical protein